MTHTTPGNPVDRQPQAHDPSDQIITARQLSRLSGVSVATIANLSKSKMIPRPIGYDGSMPLYDMGDPKLAAWVKALQDAGYSR